MSPSYTTITTAAAIGLLLFAQPCPAPLLAIPAAAAASISAVSGAVGAGAAVAGVGIAAGALANDINNNNNKRQVNATEHERRQFNTAVQPSNNGATSLWESLNLCAAYIQGSGKAITTSRPGFIEIANCPQVCGDAIEAYNSAPGLAEMDRMFGTIQWNRGTMIIDTQVVNNAGPAGQRNNNNNQGSGRGSNNNNQGFGNDRGTGRASTDSSEGNLLSDLATGDRQAAGADIAAGTRGRQGLGFKA
ncbi:uncharacterized protein AB675_10157 [Cyphellophora attinorum]|uniref:Uncharacterized protein n=1 Tax=Cyphellophora attinorum TaxID=1664694 RepID=A0A0N1HHG2_9EURO|nr:uncharacterized protein AB675_10157 [Phialophora attinorum]KPI35200.1 hypothetical protein AB675_10157 [Phialophora attinorum]